MLMPVPIIVQGEVYRSMWEKAMDEVLDRLMQVSSDGLTYVGVISVAKKAGSKGTFKPKVSYALSCMQHLQTQSTSVLCTHRYHACTAPPAKQHAYTQDLVTLSPIFVLSLAHADGSTRNLS